MSACGNTIQTASRLSARPIQPRLRGRSTEAPEIALALLVRAASRSGFWAEPPAIRRIGESTHPSSTRGISALATGMKSAGFQ